MATYVAITTINPQFGWHEVTIGKNKSSVRKSAKQKIAGAYWNKEKPIDVQTELVNLKVVSKTQAKRIYGVDIDRKQWNY
jgi:hypothetical protein